MMQSLKARASRWGAVFAIVAFSLTACQTPNDTSTTHPAGQREHPRELAGTKPRHDFRALKVSLLGKRMNEVAKLLGRPDSVYSSGKTESWDYANICYDPVSGRSVDDLEIWFESRKVVRVDGAF